MQFLLKTPMISCAAGEGASAKVRAQHSRVEQNGFSPHLLREVAVLHLRAYQGPGGAVQRRRISLPLPPHTDRRANKADADQRVSDLLQMQRHALFGNTIAGGSGCSASLGEEEGPVRRR